jgi:hypothetical protein
VSGVDLDVNKNDRFVCSDMGAVCPQGCKTPEDTSWTSIEAFLGVSVRLNEEEMLGDGSIENALVHLAWKANHADMFKGKVQEFIDSVGDSAFRDVQHLKALLKQLESKIKENYKPRDEIQEWRSQLDLASSAVEVYRQGWQVCVYNSVFCVCIITECVEVYRQGWQVLAKANPIVICCFAYEDADFSEIESQPNCDFTLYAYEDADFSEFLPVGRMHRLDCSIEAQGKECQFAAKDTESRDFPSGQGGGRSRKKQRTGRGRGPEARCPALCPRLCCHAR